MESLSMLLVLFVDGRLPSQSANIWLLLWDQPLSTQASSRWSETPWCSCDVTLWNEFKPIKQIPKSYFMILAVGGNEGKAWTLHRCPWNFDIWQLRWMLSHEPWENPSCGVGVPLVTTWKLQMLLLPREVVMKHKTKWKLSCIQSQLGWTNCCRMPD